MRVTSVLLFAAATGCATDLEVTSTEQHADGARYREYAQCSQVACRLWRARDSDGDGVADIDEEALGSDATSAAVRPRARDLYAAIGDGVLPTWNLGQMTIVVLPTQAPDGTEIFGGEATKPAREELFKMLKLGDVLGSFDLSHGVVINPALGGPDLTSPGLVMADDKSWYMGGTMPGVARDLAKTSRSDQAVDKITLGMTSDGGTSYGTVEMIRHDSSREVINWQKAVNTDTGTSVLRDEHGSVIGTHFSSATTVIEDDGTTTTTRTDTTVSSAGREKVTMQTSENGGDRWTTVERDARNNDGTRDVSSTTMHESDGNPTEVHTVNVHYDRDGNATVSGTDGGKENDAIDMLEDESLPSDGGYAYRDPDYIEPDTDLAAAELYIDPGPIHVFQDPAGPDGAPAPPTGKGVYILTTGDDVEGPCCGHVNLAGPTLLRDDYFMNHVQPDYNPDLAEPPPADLPPVGSCLDCSK